jgi:drug/metabolite transporter (DMT)-like permease
MQEFRKGFGYVLITALCFGTMEVALRMAGNSFDAIQLTFLRFLIGGCVLLPFAIRDLKKRRYHLTPGDIGYLIVLGIICVCVSMSLCQIGIMMTNASMAAVIISINPVFTMIFAHFLVNERFTLRKLLVLIISGAGLVVATGLDNLMDGNHLTGILIVLWASIALGLYTALGKKRIAVIGGMTQNCLSFLFGCAVLLLIMIPNGIPVVKGITVSSLPLLLYLGLIVTGLGYYAFLKAIAISGPSVASVAFFVKPVIAVTAAYLLLHEPITLHILIGVMLVLIGFIINILPAKAGKGVLKHETDNCKDHC